MPYTQVWVKGLQLIDILTKDSNFKYLEEIQTIEHLPMAFTYKEFKPLIKDSVLQLCSTYNTKFVKCFEGLTV